MEKRFIIFIVLCVVTVLGWGWASNRWMPKPERPTAALDQASPSPLPSPAGVQPSLKTQAPPVARTSRPAPEKRVVLSTDKVRIEFTNQGAQVSSWTVLPYREVQKDPKPVELVPGRETLGVMSPAFGVLDLPGTDLAGRSWELETPQAVTDAQGNQSVTFSTLLTGQGARLRKTFVLAPGRFLVDVKVEVSASGNQDSVLKGLSLQWGPGLGQPVQGDHSNVLSSATLGEKLERLHPSATDEQRVINGRPKWTALTNHYFVMALIPKDGPWDSTQIVHQKNSLLTGLSASLTVQPSHPVQLSAQMLGGPKEYSLLKSQGIKLERLVDFGWFEIFAVWMLYVLKWFYALTHNFGLAIILLTVVVKAVVWFPTHKSMTSMRHMQKAQAAMAPRLETLKKIYKDDKQKLNAETMKMYKEYGVNPLAGCLPMLLQMPILFALYSCLNGAFELRGASFLWVWTDLSVKDPTWILPLAMGATMFIQQKMTPTPANASPEVAQQQKLMQYLMPVMLTGMAIWTGWPAGLLLYWTASNLLSIVQQAYINKTVPA